MNVQATLFKKTIQLTTTDKGKTYQLKEGTTVTYELLDIWTSFREYFNIPGGYYTLLPKDIKLYDLWYYSDKEQLLLLYFSIDAVEGIFSDIVDFNLKSIRITCDTKELKIVHLNS